jgi:hypothetical protein
MHLAAWCSLVARRSGVSLPAAGATERFGREAEKRDREFVTHGQVQGSGEIESGPEKNDKGSRKEA